MEGRLITVRREGSVIKLVIRTNDGKKVVPVFGFNPHFYVEGNGEYLDFRGIKLKKIETKLPEDVREVRKFYNRHWQADIPFTRLFLIETGIYTWVKVPDKSTNILWHEVKPTEPMDIVPRIMLLDIEVYPGPTSLDVTKAEEPITSITSYDYYSKKYVTFAQGVDQANLTNDWIVIYVDSEREMLFNFSRFLTKLNPDYIFGWNVEYDLEYLKMRCSKLNIPVDFTAFDSLDLLSSYRRLVKQPSYSLQDVAYYENLGIIDKYSPNELALLKPSQIVKYNKSDVETMVRLLEKYNENIININLSFQKLAGTAHIYDNFASQLIDTLLLRIAHNRGLILPSKPEKRNVYEPYAGAMVTQPVPGLHKNVANLDVSRCYPSIILTFNLSPETLVTKPSKDDIIFKDIGFKREPKGIVPELVETVWRARDESEAKLKSAQPGTETYKTLESERDALKGILNAVYGFLAYQNSRIYDVRLASAITSLGREVLSFLITYFNNKGYKVLYGDTDSIFIQTPFDLAEKLIKEAEQALFAFILEKYNARSKIRLKLDKYLSTIFFTSVKKKYASRVVWENGKTCDYIDVTGFESVRRDVPAYLRQLLKDVLTMVITENDYNQIQKHIYSSIEDFKKQSLREVYITKHISKPFNLYKVKPPHIRGSLLANMYLDENIQEGDRVKMVWVKGVKGLPQTDVICFTNEKNVEGKIDIDWDKMIESTIANKLEEVLEPMGFKYSSVSSKIESLMRWM